MMAPTGGAATLSITGANSTLVQSDTSTTTVGHTTSGTATINVLNGGLFDTGTGTIAINQTGSMTLDGTASAGTFQADGAMTVRGSVQVGSTTPGTGGLLKVNAGLTIDGGTVHLLRGVVDANDISLANGGALDFDGATLHVANFQNSLTNEAGTLAPGHSAGNTNIGANYTQLGPATLEIEIAGITPGQWDTVTVAGNAILHGTIAVSLLDGFQPVLGNTFTILTTTFGNVGGSFDTELFPIFAGLSFHVVYNSQSVVLQVVEAGLPGDYNGNGVVDAADYVAWRKNDGSPAGYNTWRTHYGQTAGSGSTAASLSESAIPEPASTVLILFAAFHVTAGRRRS
jgi:hypothetical protein